MQACAAGQAENGSSYISGDLAEWLEQQKMQRVRGAPFHPQPKDKIERRGLSTPLA